MLMAPSHGAHGATRDRPDRFRAGNLDRVPVGSNRAAIKVELGAAFDLRAFHDEVLRADALPLDISSSGSPRGSPGARVRRPRRTDHQPAVRIARVIFSVEDCIFHSLRNLILTSEISYTRRA
jgi:hypothetical protein